MEKDYFEKKTIKKRQSWGENIKQKEKKPKKTCGESYRAFPTRFRVLLNVIYNLHVILNICDMRAIYNVWDFYQF